MTRALAVLAFIGWALLFSQFPICAWIVRREIRRADDRRRLNARVAEIAAWVVPVGIVRTRP